MERLIERIYDGSVTEGAWHDIMSGIVESCCARSAVLLVSDSTTGQLAFTDEFGLSQDYRRLYLDDLRRDDLRFDDLLRQPLGTLRTDSMLASYDRYVASRAYRELYSKLGTEHAMGAFLYSDGRRSIGVRLFRSRHDGAFQDQEIERYRALMPHLARSFRLRAAARVQQSRLDAMTAVMDLLPWGLLLFSRGGRLLACNAPARSWADARQPRLQAVARLVEQGFAAQERRGSLHFAASIKEADTQPLRIDLLQGAAGWSADASDGEAVALVSFARPEEAGDAGTAGLASLLGLLYGLTASERRLAARLASGESLARTAATLGIALETARTHLRNVFAKTGTRRQADLLRLILTGPAVLALPRSGRVVLKAR